jgi:hypothetical protein
VTWVLGVVRGDLVVGLLASLAWLRYRLRRFVETKTLVAILVLPKHPAFSLVTGFTP